MNREAMNVLFNEALKTKKLHNLAVQPSAKQYTVVHVPSNRIVTVYNKEVFAVLGIVLMYYTLDTMTDPFSLPVDKLRKDMTAKRCYRFLQRHSKVWNNLPMEELVGVFYRDRAECERCRQEINPDLPVEYLDKYAYDERLVADMLFHSIGVDKYNKAKGGR